MRRTMILFLPFSFLLCSCGSSGNDQPVALDESHVRLAGRVQRVNQQSRFVLIRRYGAWRVSENEVVESRGEGRTASLQPTGERLGEHVAADIRSGAVEVGDAVYVRRLFDSEMSKEPEPSGNIEKKEN